MAEALVSVAVEVVGQLLAEVVGQQLSLFAEATRELNELRSTFQSIQAVVGDAEARQVGDRSVQLWLSRLRHAAYDIQDLLEDASNHAVSRYNVPGRIKSRYNVAHRIKGIKKRLDQIDAERNRFGFSSSPMGGDHRMLVRSQRQTTSLIDESEKVIGRVNDKEMLISKLVSESSIHEADGGQVHVVAIAGIGGLGKTTLARLLYHDAKVQDHFNQAVYWVCVSEPFDVTKLTKEIIEEVKRKPATLSVLNALQDELLQSLKGKRYLLMLDDVWNDDADKWEMLRLSLASGANGSRILVTTRSEKVANTMNANYIHELKGLSDDQSWTLFSRRAFAGSREGDCSEFENIGKKIVKKCKGVPLSIKVTGSAMNTKRTVEDWKNVLESKIWSLPQAVDKILPALLLTYYYLPPHLKQCFVYCSIFPKDWEFEKDMLIRLWVAQGFIRSEGNREGEDIGEEYFNDLVARSMFQEIEAENEGNIRCKMHDLLHDLAEFIAKDEIYTFISNSKGGKSGECSSSSSDVRHAFLSFARCDDKPSKIPIAARRAKKLRTLWLHGIDKSNSGIIDLIREARFLRALYFPSSTKLPKSIGELKHLRYLHWSHSKTAKLPDTIGKMEQLRYLDLSWNKNLMELPESVSDLRNLHTLNLSGCKGLKKLPGGIGRMDGLRYLDLSCSSNIEELPESACDLRNLHTLDLSHCKKLEKLPRGIGGMVSLKYLNLSFNSNIVELPESACDLGNLHTLDLNRCRKLKKLPRGIGRMVSLRYLNLSHNNNIVELPESASDLRNLHTLNLSECAKLEKLPRGIGGMVSLRYLNLTWSDIMELPESASDLRNLHTLDLSCCTKLEKLPRGIGRMEQLRYLYLHNNSNIVELPESVGDLSNLHTLNLHGCTELKKLPRGIGGMVSLRHLEIERTRDLKYLPKGLGRISGLQSLCKFIVGGGDEGEGCGIDELQPLNSLQGTLKIEHLERVSSGEEAEESQLWNKPHLRSLYLGISAGRHDDVETERIDGVLEGLRPHENLEELYACIGSKLPSWMDGMQCLRELVLSSDLKVERLPHLSSLKEFEISSVRNEILPDEGWEQLMALRELRIKSCWELKCLPEGLMQLPSLENLRISGCNKLESMPECLGQLKKLNALEVCYMGAWRCLPDSVGQLESLESLEVRSCEKFESMPDSLGELKALRRLKIWDCGALASLPQGLRNLSLLQTLEISNCPLLTERCEREGGVDWPNISHIPNIQVNGEWIQRRWSLDSDMAEYGSQLDSDSDSDSEVASIDSG